MHRQKGSVVPFLFVGILAVAAIAYFWGPIIAFFGGLFVGGLALTGGILAGGWLLSEMTIGVGLLWLLCLGAPLVLISLLGDRGDPCVTWWWEYGDEQDNAESHEIAVSAIYVIMLAILEWGGVPIIATLKEYWWAVIPYLLFGFGVWSMKRWNDLSAYLHRRRTQVIKNIIASLGENIEDLLKVGSQLRGEPTSGDRWDHDLADQKAKLTRTLKEKIGPDEDQLEITDTLLAQWQKELFAKESGEFGAPAEFQKHIEEFINAPGVRVDVWDHKGQMYVWTMFWPTSVAFWLARKLVTLRILRDVFNFVFNRLRFIYDRIAARHESKIVFAPRDADPPAPAEGRPNLGVVTSNNIKQV